MPNLQTSKGVVSYSDCGDGPLVVLLHANPGDRRDWDAVLPALATNHRVIALDWPGNGSSPAPAHPHNVSAMWLAALLAEFVTSLDLPPAVFIGNSVGGYTAARLAIDLPRQVRALVLVDTGGFTPHNAFSRAFCATKGREGVTRVIAGLFARHYLHTRTDTTRAMIARADAHRKDRAAIAVDAAIWRSFAHPEHDLRGLAKTIHQPTLLVWGRYDPVLTLRKDALVASKSIPHATLAVLDTGHAPFAEAPEAFLAAVLPFLAKLRIHGTWDARNGELDSPQPFQAAAQAE